MNPETGLTFMQRFFTTVLPRSWAEDLRSESRSWMVQCPCGFERSIWEIGGIRWKAKGRPQRLMNCPHCGQRTWHTVYRKAVL